MKALYKTLTTILLVLVTVSCRNGLDELGPENLEIRLGADIPGAAITVKSGPVDYDTYLPDEISLLRWDEGNTVNPSAYTFEQALSATIGEPDAADEWKRYVNFDKSQYFTDRSKRVGFAACYPSVKKGSWTKEGNKLTYNIFENDDIDVMVSDFKSGTYTSGIDPLQFQHALCLYNVYVYAVDEQASQAWGNIENITFINLPEELYVTLPDDMTSPDAEVSFSYSPKPDDNVYTPKTLFSTPQNITIPVGINNRAKIGHILGGPPAIGLLGLSAETVSEDNSTSPVSIARNFRPGHIYNLLLRFSEHGVINAEVSVEEWQHDDGEYNNPYYADMETASRFLTNLSRYGTSNSYIASSGNMGYCFNATVKGNGVNSLKDWEGNSYVMPDASVSITPAYVEILHSDVLLKHTDSGYIKTSDEEKHTLDLIKLRSRNLIDGYVLFDVEGVEGAEDIDFTLPYMGNAVIAAYNTIGEIIWTWHIWVTDRPYNVNYGNGYIAQDRNLGACVHNGDLYPEIAEGLYYQWGRKDPIFPQHETIDGPLTMTESHLNPDKEINSSSNDWLRSNYDYLWGYVAERVDVRKTMYDPCPLGYRVSDNHTFQDIPGTARANGDGYIYEIGEYDVYFPDLLLSSATPAESGMSNVYRINERGFSSDQSKRVEKMNIRCVVENSTPVVHNLDENQSANCHLITEPGYYRFDATTLGNGVRGFNVVLSQGNIGQVLIDNGYNPLPIQRIDVFAWQGDITPGSSFRTFANGDHTTDEIENACPVKMLDGGRLTDGNAYYYIPSGDSFVPGNVILAGYDSNDEIVWTWHLWIAPDGVGEEKWGKYIVLDRNIGATWRPSQASELTQDNHPSSVGFYYQWGRKDPLPMPRKNNGNNLYAPLYRKVNGVWTKETTLASQAAGTIEESVKNPHKYFNRNTNTTGNYWQTSWVDVNGQNTEAPLRNIWGYTGVEGSTGDTFVKTMWDPCPAGYKVGSHEVLFGWNVGANTDNRKEITGSTDFGIFNTEDANSKWLPETGRINNGGVLEEPENNAGYLNCSCPFANGSVYRGLYYYIQNATQYIGQSANSNECMAVPVRCVRE